MRCEFIMYIIQHILSFYLCNLYLWLVSLLTIHHVDDFRSVCCSQSMNNNPSILCVASYKQGDHTSRLYYKHITKHIKVSIYVYISSLVEGKYPIEVEHILTHTHIPTPYVANAKALLRS